MIVECVGGLSDIRALVLASLAVEAGHQTSQTTCLRLIPRVDTTFASLFEKVDGDLSSRIQRSTEEKVLARAEKMVRKQQIANEIGEKRKADMAHDHDH